MPTLAFLLFFPLFTIISIVLYFLPTILASQRRHHNVLGVFLLNFFLGWSVIGWIVALVWSLSAPPVVAVPGGYPTPGSYPTYSTPPPVATLCPKCGAPLQPGAPFCSNCGTHV